MAQIFKTTKQLQTKKKVTEKYATFICVEIKSLERSIPIDQQPQPNNKTSQSE
jgi:hypothetical protein